MKKVFAVALMIVGLTTFAQGKGEKRERLSPEQQTELHVKKMTLDLDLTEKQQNAIKPVLLEEAKKREKIQEERKAKKEKEEIASKEERFAMKEKMLDNQIALKEKMKSILTPDQMAKWESLKENKQEERQEKMLHKKMKMKSKE
jgi:periplasmic protein CpxP/Spy